jgi:ketosteroid isomerase-like protein
VATDRDDEDVPRRAFLASNRGDTEEFLAHLAEDIEWRSAGLFLYPAKLYQGRESIRNALRTTAEHRGGRPQVTLRELDAHEGRVLVTATVSIPTSRRRETLPIAWIMDVRDGAIAKVKTFRGEQQARAEFLGR